MTRYRATAEGNIPFTPEEEAEWDAREAAYLAGAPEREAAATRKAAKQARAAAVDAITVTTSTGKVFDGNLAALQNMTSAYVVGTESNIASTPWTLADNSRVEVTLAEIKEAMTLSGLEISRLWALP